MRAQYESAVLLITCVALGKRRTGEYPVSAHAVMEALGTLGAHYMVLYEAVKKANEG